ncbi:MAG: 16S rRNA (guanine(527)-N(7))-methyltransferase RsmG [Betaproteobacteria bacterium]
MAPLEFDLSEQIVRELAQDATPNSAKLLVDFLKLLDKWNNVYNLTSISPKQMWVSAHIYDSLSICRMIPTGSVLDVGTGGGFPGIPLAITQPQREFALLDRSQKKTSFLRQAVIELGLSNVKIITSRIEAYKTDRLFDVIVSRAFSDLRPFVESVERLLSPTGVLLAMKGKNPTSEIDSLPSGWVQQTVALDVPRLDAERHLVVLTKNKLMTED